MRVFYASLWLCGVIILVFLAQVTLGLDLAWTVGTIEPNFFFSMIAHGSTAHLLGNLFALFLFGLILEGVVGSRKVLLVLLVAGIVGNLAGIGTYTRIIGISGAVYGLMGALAVLRPKMVVWISGLPAPMIVAALAWAAVDFLGLFANTSTGHLAHLAGIAVGAAFGFLWKKQFPSQTKKRRGKRDSHIERRLDTWERHYMR